MSLCRVILLDDHPIVLAGLSELVGQLGDYEVVGTGRSAGDAIHLTEDLSPDLVIMDMNMPGDVLEAIDQIATRPQAPPVVIFTASDLVSDCNAAMAHGARGYVVKGSSGHEIFEALSIVIHGRDYISADLAARMVREMRRSQACARDEVRLSLREEQIVRELLNGASNRCIAQKLDLSEKTVKYYMTQIMQKLQVENRLQVALAAQSRLSRP